MKVFIWWLHAMNACLVAHKVKILQDKMHCQVSTSYHWPLSLCFVYFYVERQRELSTTIEKKSCLVYSTNEACDSKKQTNKQIRLIHKTNHWFACMLMSPVRQKMTRLLIYSSICISIPKLWKYINKFMSLERSKFVSVLNKQVQ